MAQSSICFTKGFLAGSGKPSDLVKKLVITHSTLRAIDQDTSVPGLDNLAAGLVLPGLLHSSGSEEVALLTCCCLVDVLRLYAPDAPYSDVQKLVRPLSLPQLPIHNAQWCWDSSLTPLPPPLHPLPHCATPHSRTLAGYF